jgi:hypothetical protein
MLESGVTFTLHDLRYPYPRVGKLRSQGTHTCIAIVALDDASEDLLRNVLHDLRKQCLAYVHAFQIVDTHGSLKTPTVPLSGFLIRTQATDRYLLIRAYYSRLYTSISCPSVTEEG